MGIHTRDATQSAFAIAATASMFLLAACAATPVPQAPLVSAAVATTAPATRPDAALVAAGDTVFHENSCIACHGEDAKGTSVAPDLTDATWLTGDGSVGAIAKIVTEGVDEPKQFRSPMPAMGGSDLSEADVKAVAAYLWSLSHK